MSYQELVEHQRNAKAGMFNSRDKFERAVWINLYRWATKEIERHTAVTVSALR